MSAAHRLSGYTVSEIARRTTSEEIGAVEEHVRLLKSEMQSRGVTASSFIHQEVPAGVYNEGNYCVVDRKQAYRYEFEQMRVCAAVCAVFSDPWNTLLAWARESKNAQVLKGVQADVDLMRNDHDSLKKGKLYKITYGMLCAAKKADRKMPDLFVRRMALIGEYARRRNAVTMMRLADAAGKSFMAAYTDSLLLRGVDAEATAASLSDAEQGLMLKVESRARVVVLAKINTHLFVLDNGDVLTRPHEMFGEELSQSGLDAAALEAFKNAVVEACSTKNYQMMRDIYDQIPAELDMPSATGKNGRREPSVRRLLGHVLFVGNNSPSRKRKRSAGATFYGKLGDAKRAQESVQEACFVVGEDRAGSKGLYRRWSLLRPSELVQCLGKPCHMTFVGSRVAYRVVVDYDEPQPLKDANVDACAEHIRQFWRDRKQLQVNVRCLRTKTKRQGAKSHAEHIVFVVQDKATSKECVLLNPEEIPLAVGASIHVDNLIYKLGKSLRLAGCPKLDTDGHLNDVSVHVPKQCLESEIQWSPDGKEYALWCPCVILGDSFITHCDTPPSHSHSAARRKCAFLFPSELLLADAFVRWIDGLCEHDYDYDSPKMFYWNKGKDCDPDCNSFIMTVIFKSKTSKTKKFLDYADFAKRVAVPHLKNGFSKCTVADCKHHGSNHSYFVFKIDADSAYGKGEIRGVNANTHHDKVKTKSVRSSSSDYGGYIPLDHAAKCNIIGEEGRREYEAAVAAERNAKLSITLAKKSEYDAECRQVNSYRVRLALLRRHRAHQPGRKFPTTGRRDGWTERSNGSHEDTVIAVTALMQLAPKDVALRALYTELKYYTTNFRGRRAGYVVEALETLRDASEQPGYWEGRQTAQTAIWESVVRYGDRITYKNEVY